MKLSLKTYLLQEFTGGMCYVKISPADYLALTEKNNKRVTFTLPGYKPLHVALNKRAQLGAFIMIGKKHCKLRNIAVGDQFEAAIAIDRSEYQFEFPEVFGEVLRTDPEAKAVFNKLTKGNQRSILSIITAVKREQTQIDRALKITDLLKQGITKGQEIMSLLRHK